MTRDLKPWADVALSVGAIRNGSFSHEHLFLFTFEDASSSDGLLVSFSRVRQTCQKMSERKPCHQRVAARGKDQRKIRQGEAMTKTPGEVEPFKPITKAVRDARKAFRQVDAEKAVTEHEISQKAFSANRERLKAERLAREAELKAKGK